MTSNEVLNKIKEWANDYPSHLCNYEGYPMGYRNGFIEGKEAVKRILKDWDEPQEDTTPSDELQYLENTIMEQAQQRILTARHDYNAGMNDCKHSVYDKWFRYHRKDDGRAYDLGWMAQNKTTKVETVQFIQS